MICSACAEPWPGSTEEVLRGLETNLFGVGVKTQTALRAAPRAKGVLWAHAAWMLPARRRRFRQVS
jgi:hypothetical protein